LVISLNPVTQGDVAMEPFVILNLEMWMNIYPVKHIETEEAPRRKRLPIPEVLG
jgi:hypothetical protein